MECELLLPSLSALSAINQRQDQTKHRSNKNSKPSALHSIHFVPPFRLGSSGAPVSLGSIMKSILDLHEDLARFEEMGPSRKGQTVIQQEPPIGDVQRRHRDRYAFTDTLPQRNIGGRMSRKMIWTAAVGEARTVVDISIGPSMARKIEIQARAERVALIVIQEEPSSGRRKIGQTPVNSSEALRVLVRVG